MINLSTWPLWSFYLNEISSTVCIYKRLGICYPWSSTQNICIRKEQCEYFLCIETMIWYEISYKAPFCLYLRKLIVSFIILMITDLFFFRSINTNLVDIRFIVAWSYRQQWKARRLAEWKKSISFTIKGNCMVFKYY